MRKTIWSILGCSCLTILGLGCLCSALSLTAVGAAANLVEIPFRLFQKESATQPNLYRVLKNGSATAFKLGDNCNFTYTNGYVINSSSESTPSDGYARDLNSQQVIDAVLTSFEANVFLVHDGGISLESGVPVQIDYLPSEKVYLSFDEKASTDTSVTTQSLAGVVEDKMMTGKYQSTRSISAVENGQALEEATSILADFVCPIRWLPAE